MIINIFAPYDSNVFYKFIKCQTKTIGVMEYFHVHTVKFNSTGRHAGILTLPVIIAVATIVHQWKVWLKSEMLHNTNRPAILLHQNVVEIWPLVPLQNNSKEIK